METAVVSATTALVVVVLVKILEIRVDEVRENRRVRNEYLNPLRLYLEESHFRTSEILRKVAEGDGRCDILLTVSGPHELSERNARWFVDEGCYLASSCYFTACMFAWMWRVRAHIPYLKLRRGKDTVFLQMLLGISRTFNQYLGVFYAIQHSIGQLMWDDRLNRLRSYREFCELLQDEQHRVWFDRLIVFYLETGSGTHLDRAEAAVRAMETASAFIDRTVGGATSIGARTVAESNIAGGSRRAA